MEQPWSPASTYSEADSVFSLAGEVHVDQHRPATYMIVKMQAGNIDWASSNKEVVKMLPQSAKDDIEYTLKIVEQHATPYAGNSYQQMLREVEALHTRDPNPEDVKDLRRHIPLFRKIDHMSAEEIEKKIKVKCMWTEKPYDWPHDVQHVDPNNPGTIRGVRIPKPKKPDLVKMFNWLTQKYKIIRHDLWMREFGCSPDDDVKPAIIIPDKNLSSSSNNKLRDLRRSVVNLYSENGKIEHLLNILIKEIEKTDTLKDEIKWCKFNRQRSVLEGDLLEIIYLKKRGKGHAPDLVVQELMTIAKNLGMSEKELNKSVEEERENMTLPLVVEEARSPLTPTKMSNHGNTRKRKPTLNLQMEEQQYGQDMVTPTPTVINMMPTVLKQELVDSHAVYVSETMEVANYEDVQSDEVSAGFGNNQELNYVELLPVSGNEGIQVWAQPVSQEGVESQTAVVILNNGQNLLQSVLEVENSPSFTLEDNNFINQEHMSEETLNYTQQDHNHVPRVDSNNGTKAVHTMMSLDDDLDLCLNDLQEIIEGSSNMDVIYGKDVFLTV